VISLFSTIINNYLFKKHISSTCHVIVLFRWDWGLNSELCDCKAGALPLELHVQSVLLWLFWKWRSPELFDLLALNHDPPDLGFPSNFDYRGEPLALGCITVFLKPKLTVF
jgi:hypothetical protein